MPLLKPVVLYDFLIVYEDVESKVTKRFHVEAPRGGIAVARTVKFIDDNKLHSGKRGYSLSIDPLRRGKVHTWVEVDYKIKWNDDF